MPCAKAGNETPEAVRAASTRTVKVRGMRRCWGEEEYILPLSLLELAAFGQLAAGLAFRLDWMTIAFVKAATTTAFLAQ